MEKLALGRAQRPIVAKSSFSSPILYAPTHFVCLIYYQNWYTFSKIVPQNPLQLLIYNRAKESIAISSHSVCLNVAMQEKYNGHEGS
jgi:hypothetical protein